MSCRIPVDYDATMSGLPGILCAVSGTSRVGRILGIVVVQLVWAASLCGQGPVYSGSTPCVGRVCFCDEIH